MATNKQIEFNTKSLDLAALEGLRGCLVQDFRALYKEDGTWDVVITGYKPETFFMEAPNPLPRRKVGVLMKSLLGSVRPRLRHPHNIRVQRPGF